MSTIEVTEVTGHVTAEVTGSVAIQNQPLAVRGTFWQPVQDIAGKVEITNLPSTQAVTGLFFPPIQDVKGDVWINNFPSSFGVTGEVKVTNPVTELTITGAVEVLNFPPAASISFPAKMSVTGEFYPEVQKVLVQNPVEINEIKITNLPKIQEINGQVEARQYVFDGGEWVPAPLTGLTGIPTKSQGVQSVAITQSLPLTVQGNFWQNIQPTQDAQVIELLKEILAVLKARK